MALVISTAATAALTHTGATGIVLERMNGMTAMRDVVAELAPMMQGAVPYDAFQVSEGAGVIAGHAGKTMLSLFPENSLEGMTYARPQIWIEWQKFAALASELETYAEALSEAAPNGLEPAMRPTEGMGAMDDSAMAVPPAEKVFTVAELMGYAKPTAGAQANPVTADPAVPRTDLTALAADDLFARISATCSSCHAQFRAGRN
jgi:cytochrome c556